MPQSVRDRTAKWRRDGEQEDRVNRALVLIWLLMAGVMFTSAVMFELGWAYLGAAGFLMWLAWWRRPKRPGSK